MVPPRSKELHIITKGVTNKTVYFYPFLDMATFYLLSKLVPKDAFRTCSTSNQKLASFAMTSLIEYKLFTFDMAVWPAILSRSTSFVATNESSPDIGYQALAMNIQCTMIDQLYFKLFAMMVFYRTAHRFVHGLKLLSFLIK